MNRLIHGATLGTVGLALIVLAGCENNEANVKGTGVTPPGAAATSEAGATFAPLPKTKSLPPAGYGASAKGYGGAQKHQ
jgi:hypothetical protein